jgi:hypothetical protein
MKPSNLRSRRTRRGAALILSMIFIVMFIALAAAMATMSGANVQLASNQHHANEALNSAHSGIEIVRYYLNGISIPVGTPANRLDGISQELGQKVADVQSINPVYDATLKELTIPLVSLSASGNTSFSATVTYGANADGTPDYDTLDVTITGNGGQATKQVGVSYAFTEIGNPIFDYGIATKGPLLTQGSVDVDTFNESFWADIYIESLNSSLALEMIGKSSIAGKVMIANGAANFTIANSSSVYGASGSDAGQYVTCGVDQCTFPVPNPTQFEPYIQNVYDPATSTGPTFTNIEIPAGTNPSFGGGTTINGIMYVRQPNSVTFRGNCTINGIIIAEGDVENPSELNELDFNGTVTGYDTSSLPPSLFGDLTEKTGTFILAPGFRVSFGGNSSMINGVIAASGVEFYGNAGGQINGSIINYSELRMDLQGNTDLVFNRSGADEIPAGFEPSTTLNFVANSYSEGCM